MKYTPRLYAQAYLAAQAACPPSEVSQLARRFWQMVWQHKHFAWRRQIITTVKDLWYEQQGVIEVEVATVRPLPLALLHDLEKSLETFMASRVELKSVLKPHLLAGAVLTIGDTRIDASLKARLTSLYNHLAGLKT